MDIFTTALAFAAGLLSVLSPCILPLLPVVLGSAVAQSRLAPFAVAAGLALSFTTAGLVVASLGFSLGITNDSLRNLGAVLLVATGIVLLIAPLQNALTRVLEPLAAWGHSRTSASAERKGLFSHFALGLLLGTVWAPCAGPTLGAAAALAAQGKDYLQVTFTMTAFAIGSALPLVLMGLVSRQAIQSWRGRMAAGGKFGKRALGAVMLLIGGLILSGLDVPLQATALSIMPDWMVRLETRF